MLKRPKYLLIYAIIFAALLCLILKVQFSKSLPNYKSNDEGITIVSGNIPSAGSINRGITRLPTINPNVIKTNIPPTFDEMKATVLGSPSDAAWSSNTEQRLFYLAASLGTISEFKAKCQVAGCVISGILKTSQQNYNPFAQVNNIIEEEPSLVSSDLAGDQYVMYKIASLDPMVITFSAIGFKR